MSKTLPAIKTGWWSIELPGYRPHAKRTTYSLFSYEALPPVGLQLGDDFKWLEAESIKKGGLDLGGDYDDDSKPELEKLSDLITQIDVQLPVAFTTFLKSMDLHKRIRSCTACYLEIADRPVRTLGTSKGFLIHFLSDQQWGVHWYLHVDYGGNHCVVTSLRAYGFSYPEDDVVCGKDEIELEHEDIYFCAPTFVEFIYRFWLENEIWYALVWDKRPLTAIQQTYVNHYLKPKQAA